MIVGCCLFYRINSNCFLDSVFFRGKSFDNFLDGRLGPRRIGLPAIFAGAPLTDILPVQFTFEVHHSGII